MSHLDPDPTDLQVGSWADLADLPGTLALLEKDGATIVRRARAEVCDPAGFEPSPVCVLRPLVPVLQRVEEAFADLGAALAGEVQRLREASLQAARELADADAAAVANAVGVLGEVA